MTLESFLISRMISERCDVSELSNNNYASIEHVGSQTAVNDKVNSNDVIRVTCEQTPRHDFEGRPDIEHMDITCKKGRFQNIRICEHGMNTPTTA